MYTTKKANLLLFDHHHHSLPHIPEFPHQCGPFPSIHLRPNPHTFPYFSHLYSLAWLFEIPQTKASHHYSHPLPKSWTVSAQNHHPIRLATPWRQCTHPHYHQTPQTHDECIDHA